MSDEVKVTIAPNIGSIAERIRARLNGGMKKSLLKAAEFAAGELRRKVRDKFNQHTGGLGRSFRATLISDEGDLKSGAFSDAVQAGILEHGGTIRPKTTKMLSIPIGPRAKRTVGLWPRHWGKGELFSFKSKAGKILLASREGNVITLQYVLKKFVTIRGRHYIKDCETSVRAVVRQILHEEIAA